MSLCISLIAFIIAVFNSCYLVKKLRYANKRLRLEEDNSRSWQRLAETLDKRLKIVHIELDATKIKYEALQKEVTTDDKGRNEQNPCCHKCVLPLFLPRYERRRKKSHY